MLAEILSQKRKELEGIDFQSEIERLRKRVCDSGSVRSLKTSVTKESGISLIAEIKRCSPSTGAISKNLDVERTVKSYQEAGARAVSVLTDSMFFGGSIDDLKVARSCTGLPILRKDFLLEEFQIWEARSIGADAVLLIAAMLSAERLYRLHCLAKQIGLEVLVEVHTEEEIEQAMKVSPDIVGINNRNLHSLEVNLKVTENLRPLVPAGVVCVSESGIRSRQDVLRMQDLGVHAVLVGEELVKSADPCLRIQELLGKGE